MLCEYNLQGACLGFTLEVPALYHLDRKEKSGIIDFALEDIDIVNKF